MMASALAIGLGSPVGRLSPSDAHSSSCAFDREIASAPTLKNPGSFSGFHRISVESPRVASPRRDGGGVFQAYAGASTCGRETEEREEVASPSPHGRSGGEPTLYDILGVSENAGLKEIKSAFRQLARRFHPDVNAEEQRDECTRDFMQIHVAYTTLSDLQTKTVYDLHLSMQRFRRNGYAGGLVCSLTQNWDLSPATTDFAAPEQNWMSPSPSGYSPPSGFAHRATYSAPTSLNSEWKARTWETDQCW